MHILYIYAEISIKGGTDKVLVEKANYLVNHGYEVTIVTESQMGRPLSFELDSKVKHIDIALDFNKQYIQGIFKRLYTYSSLMCKYKKLLKKVIQKQHPDIVITTMGRSLSLLSKIGFDGVKIGEAHTTKMHLRSLHLMEQRGGIFKLLAIYMRWSMCRNVSKLDALVLLTKTDADDWKGKTKTYVIPNPIPFYPTESALLEKKQVIMVGRYNDAKGYDYLIPAWEIVHHRHPDWILQVYGSGELYDDVVNWIKEHKIEDSIVLNEPIDDIKSKYLESSICVLSSIYEGFSLVILESMACGVPVVSFDCPYGPRNIIKDGEDGLLIDFLNIDALAEGLCYLIEDNEKRKIMGINARKNVLRFSKQTVMRQWEGLFRELTKS
jgi:glycosyltransferase involved in cell wall biosynthesis